MLIWAGLGLGLACREESGVAPRAPEIAAQAHENPAEPEPSAPTALEPAPAPPAPALPDFSLPEWTRLTSRAGKYTVCWRSTPAKIPRNADFELEAWVLRDGQNIGEALLGVSGWMPDHGHGMLRQPKIERREDGAFLVHGMLLHMRGRWQLFFEVLEGSLAETAEFALEI